MPEVSSPAPDLVALLTGHGVRDDRLTHVHRVPARAARPVDWPGWLAPAVRDALVRRGIERPWEHQVRTAEAAWAGRSVVVGTGTASGKTLGFWLPALTAALATRPDPDQGTTLYLSPTKALAADQLRALDALEVPGLVATPYDGDTPHELREVARGYARYLLSNPDMLHRSLLPQHQRWTRFLRDLRFVVVDEAHTYRGVFGSHVAQVLRRLLRLARSHGADPVVVLASATTADPATTGLRLTGGAVDVVAEDASPHGATTMALWDPPPHAVDADARRSVLAETSDLLTDLVLGGARTVAFVRSRRAAETVAALSRAALAEVSPGAETQVAAYRGGYLADERRAVERALSDGSLTGVASTTALELGVDIAGLDAVLIAGWPGTRASLWQQAGRAGRAGQESVAVLVARDDPLDAYLVHHPEAIFGAPVEATVLDPDNPHVLGPHLCAAASELPLSPADLPLFGPAAEPLLDSLVAAGRLRRRRDRWYWTSREPAADLADLRGSGGRPVALVEDGTGRLLGTVDAARAHGTVHPGAVYVHQGETSVVLSLDLEEAVATVQVRPVDYSTSARSVSDTRVVQTEQTRSRDGGTLSLGVVDVTSQVVSYLRRRASTGEVLGEQPLDLPAQTLRTRSVWWTLSDDVVAAAGVDPADAPGAAHAAEHAAIGMLPLVATCDRWDVGGLSTAVHPDTGVLTVFVHDAHPGGAGFAERGFTAARTWWQATLDVVAGCPCQHGCPACVQSPKCGNGNNPLDKAGAVRLLRALLATRVGELSG